MIKKPLKQFEICSICNHNFKSIFAKQCKECYNKSQKGSGNTNYRTGKWCDRHFCPECGKDTYCETKTGLCFSCWNNNLKPEERGNYQGGKTNPKNCLDCGTKIGYRSIRCIDCARKGELNGRYVHGMQFSPYSSNFNSTLKINIRNRDNFVCQKCGLSEKNHIKKFKESLHVHHIDYNKENCFLFFCNQAQG